MNYERIKKIASRDRCCLVTFDETVEMAKHILDLKECLTPAGRLDLSMARLTEEALRKEISFLKSTNEKNKSLETEIQLNVKALEERDETIRRYEKTIAEERRSVSKLVESHFVQNKHIADLEKKLLQRGVYFDSDLLDQIDKLKKDLENEKKHTAVNFDAWRQENDARIRAENKLRALDEAAEIGRQALKKETEHAKYLSDRLAYLESARARFQRELARFTERFHGVPVNSSIFNGPPQADKAETAEKGDCATDAVGYSSGPSAPVETRGETPKVKGLRASLNGVELEIVDWKITHNYQGRVKEGMFTAI